MEEKIYKVTWTIEVSASDHVEAAKLAQAVQRDVNSIATVYRVQRAKQVAKQIDLAEYREHDFSSCDHCANCGTKEHSPRSYEACDNSFN